MDADGAIDVPPDAYGGRTSTSGRAPRKGHPAGFAVASIIRASASVPNDLMLVAGELHRPEGWNAWLTFAISPKAPETTAPKPLQRKY